jgi:hypothetical protein
MDPIQFFTYIIRSHRDDAGLIFATFHVCKRASPSDEDELTGKCLEAFLGILKQRILDSMPSASHSRMKLLSLIVPIEETLELIPPENYEQLSDFAVILAMAFAAVDFSNCADDFNGHSSQISPMVSVPLRELFSLVWFIRWRFAVICDAARSGHATDATLRLLAFPEFVNLRAARSQIATAVEATFSPDVLVL